MEFPRPELAQRNPGPHPAPQQYPHRQPATGEWAGPASDHGSGLGVIPVQPLPYNLPGKYQKRILINRRIINTATGREVAATPAGFGIPVRAAHTGQRVAFAESAANGNTDAVRERLETHFPPW